MFKYIFADMSNLFNFICNSLCICSGIFGIYASIRLYSINKTHRYYIFWLFATALMFLDYCFVRMGICDNFPILYRIFGPLFFLSPLCLYLYFGFLLKRAPPKRLFLHLIPFFISLTITLRTVIFYPESIIVNVKAIQLQWLHLDHAYVGTPFEIEQLMFAFRSAIFLFYIVLITRQISASQQLELKSTLNRIFLPVKINAYMVFLVLIPSQIMGRIFETEFNHFYLINGVILVSCGMFLWHILMLLRNFEETNSVFKIHLEPVSRLPDMSEKSLFLLNQIYDLKLYLDPLLSVEKAANIVKSSELKFSKDFNDDIPFSLSSYVNYLRLLHFEKNEKANFTKEANIYNAGFNTRASYYQWEKRKHKLSVQIDPVLDYFYLTNASKSRHKS